MNFIAAVTICLCLAFIAVDFGIVRWETDQNGFRSRRLDYIWGAGRSTSTWFLNQLEVLRFLAHFSALQFRLRSLNLGRRPLRIRTSLNHTQSPSNVRKSRDLQRGPLQPGDDHRQVLHPPSYHRIFPIRKFKIVPWTSPLSSCAIPLRVPWWSFFMVHLSARIGIRASGPIVSVSTPSSSPSTNSGRKPLCSD